MVIILDPERGVPTILIDKEACFLYGQVLPRVPSADVCAVRSTPEIVPAQQKNLTSDLSQRKACMVGDQPGTDACKERPHLIGP